MCRAAGVLCPANMLGVTKGREKCMAAVTCDIGQGVRAWWG